MFCLYRDMNAEATSHTTAGKTLDQSQSYLTVALTSMFGSVTISWKMVNELQRCILIVILGFWDVKVLKEKVHTAKSC